ncbi:hypothetical protein BU26DRAFT_526988 [Trematosphaeria pertusa]|uniref:Survival Motor Neuron Gemin2-binding domain-containing protein n=1 Tax=Trematosphaeria pertusa TaxID=390896 RepID=A0A6A6J441_9PLEO|nr:uncharacterized protein BU26DRAFT_526988 [Trematosphaeria pertusa]KAF2256660.1 hypothetical protein BU26DRAFT_526988 [Trematosphaeria pertusa]
MAPGVSLDDRSAWDDSALINSWEEAVAEYDKYHSIQRSGKRLEDVLSQEELKQLREEHGNLIEEVETRSNAADPNRPAGQENDEWPQEETNGDGGIGETQSHAEERTASGDQEHARTSETTRPHDGPLAASMPQAVLGTVQDENLRNLMMSWYYAGYYTGLVAGQQQAASNNATSNEQK